ncbi:MAG: hypothetical protein M0R28_02440 [Pigmentiphaga sp.]|nr:hypothetical protein [Pigmentiphaga sp.]
MLEDLDLLSDRIRQLTQLLDGAHAEHQALAQRLEHAQADNQRLRALLAMARDRVDNVLTRLPDPDAPPPSQTAAEAGHGTA